MLLRSGFGIGRWFGIKVRIDWSWLLIFFLVVWNLGVVFTQFHPAWSFLLVWGLAVVASLLFFLSVLAHEMAHSLVARSRGLPVNSITLFLFGGVSNIEKEPPSPKTEFLMAIVGPLTSLVIGGVLLLLSGLIGRSAIGAAANTGGLIGNLSPTATILLWLGSVNILLGIFNLIPGFPLDGGRVLRSILWGITDNVRKATRWAAWVGQGIAWLFILAGIAMALGVTLPFFGTGLLSGLWLAFIGWFLNSAASQSYRQVVIKDILEDIPVGRIMRPDPPTVPSNIYIDELVNERVMRSDDHAFPVVDNGALLGIVTLDDIRKVPRERWDQTLVRDAMTPADKLNTVTRSSDAAEAMQTLSASDIRQLPVVDENHNLIGLLRRRDLIRFLQIHSEENTF